MITRADRLRADKLSKTLENYFLDELEKWETALDAISQAQSYTISNGQSSSRTLTRANINEVQNQVTKWTEKLQNLDDTSTIAPRISTIFTRRFNG